MQQCFAISLYSQSQFFTDLLCSPEGDFKHRPDALCYTASVTTFHFMNMFYRLQLFNLLVFKVVYTKGSQCNKWILFCKMSIHRCLSSLTCSKFITILISSFWIYVACVCCCDWNKLWLLVIFYMILLKIRSWYLISISTCFTLPFSLVVNMEYALLNKEETTSIATCLVVRTVV